MQNGSFNHLDLFLKIIINSSLIFYLYYLYLYDYTYHILPLSNLTFAQYSSAVNHNVIEQNHYGLLAVYNLV